MFRQRQFLILMLVSLLLSAGCESTYEFYPADASYPPRGQPAREVRDAPDDLAHSGYVKIGTISGSVRLDDDEALTYSFAQTKSVPAGETCDQHIAEQTVADICKLAAEHGGDLVVRQPDQQERRWDTVTEISDDPRARPGTYSVSRMYSGGELVSETKASGAFKSTSQEFTFVTHKWDVWRQYSDESPPEKQ